MFKKVFSVIVFMGLLSVNTQANLSLVKDNSASPSESGLYGYDCVQTKSEQGEMLRLGTMTLDFEENELLDKNEASTTGDMFLYFYRRVGRKRGVEALYIIDTVEVNPERQKTLRTLWSDSDFLFTNINQRMARPPIKRNSAILNFNSQKSSKDKFSISPELLSTSIPLYNELFGGIPIYKYEGNFTFPAEVLKSKPLKFEGQLYIRFDDKFSGYLEVLCKKSNEDGGLKESVGHAVLEPENEKDKKLKRVVLPATTDLDIETKKQFDRISGKWNSLNPIDKSQVLSFIAVGGAAAMWGSSAIMAILPRIIAPLSFFISTGLNAEDSFEDQTTNIKIINRTMSNYNTFYYHTEESVYASELKVFYEKLEDQLLAN